jgi:hypothetical protein
VSGSHRRVALVGAGAVCAACCAGPVLGWVAAIGLGTAAGVAAFGGAGLAVAVVGGLALLVRRRFARRRRRSKIVRQQVELAVDGGGVPEAAHGDDAVLDDGHEVDALHGDTAASRLGRDVPVRSDVAP